jgi:putative zinc finger/helix-turn-helix YgiT family protein
MAAASLKRCMHCRERAVSPTKLDSYETELEHDGRKYAISVADFSVLKCQHCGAIYLDEAADERLSEALRTKAGLLLPGEIRKGREDLGLTQKQLANLIRISEFTLSRWETGAQIQQRSMDAFLRVVFQSADARRILGAPEAEPRMVAIDARIATSEFGFLPRHYPRRDPQEAGLSKGFSTLTPTRQNARYMSVQTKNKPEIAA